MRTLMIALLMTLVTQLGVGNANASDKTLAQAIEAIDANVIFMRHALAPGFGDPNNFVLPDCSTQRNLNAEGRAQAEKIGAGILKAGLSFKEIISSEWCRCMQTAELLDLGNWTIFHGLNSFFQDYADRKTTLELLNNKLSSIDNGLILMVTHQVVISAVTKRVISSGEIVVYNSKNFEAKPFKME
jgi:phosphohistidine phosphatase SixA